MMTERQFSFPRLLVNLSCLLLAAVLWVLFLVLVNR